MSHSKGTRVVKAHAMRTALRGLDTPRSAADTEFRETPISSASCA
uniref:Uncharacterized protein n=1 Tax=Siphoviridae sp. ctnR15 TaxID=2827938 RepID=A0A8S5T1M5_9CAUD|nr:MAG TPA: hypothetical protein [Siphoviridae sp. ctnR15]